MKVNWKRFALLFVFVFLLVACAPQPEGIATSSAVQIPEALVLAFNALVLAGVTIGLQVVFDGIGLDLRGIGAALAIALSAFVLAQLQGLIDVIPALYDTLVSIALNIIVVILAGLGYLRLIVNRTRAAELLHTRRG